MRASGAPAGAVGCALVELRSISVVPAAALGAGAQARSEAVQGSSRGATAAGVGELLSKQPLWHLEWPGAWSAATQERLAAPNHEAAENIEPNEGIPSTLFG